jgi:FAD/FMN-containing dehydrogenase
MDRRGFLRHAGGLVVAAPPLAAFLASCTRANDSFRALQAGASASPRSGAGTPPWNQLAAELHGKLILPGMPGYPVARLGYDPRFDGIHPRAIVKAVSAADVAHTIAFARAHGLRFAARSGGHSYAGYSLSHGIVIDVSPMAAVRPHPATDTVTIGAGARLIEVAAGLAPTGRMLPGGTCATVGISGLTMGGGQGVTGRRFGLTCDSLRSATVVLADGSVVTADASTHPDLFWALRGGGGGNFGVVTSFTFATHALARLTAFSLSWPWSRADDVLKAWQTWAPNAPAPLWSSCRLRWIPGSGPSVSVSGAWSAAPAGLAGHLDQLASAVGSAPTRSVRTMSYLDAEMYFAGCSGFAVDDCSLTVDGGRLSRQGSLAKSDFFDRAIPNAVIGKLLGRIEARGGAPALSSHGGGVLFDAWGGKIAQTAPNATALPHRHAHFLAQEFVTFGSLTQAELTANRHWLHALWQTLRPAASGFAYVNYIDPDLTGWLHAYYGANLARLVEVKRTYDPQDAFRFAQSIPTSLPA